MSNDCEGDADEYLDAFVALGGDADKTGTIHKNTLIEIIKIEFELTIEMSVSFFEPRFVLSCLLECFVLIMTRCLPECV